MSGDSKSTNWNFCCPSKKSCSIRPMMFVMVATRIIWGCSKSTTSSFIPGLNLWAFIFWIKHCKCKLMHHYRWKWKELWKPAGQEKIQRLSPLGEEGHEGLEGGGGVSMLTYSKQMCRSKWCPTKCQILVPCKCLLGVTWNSKCEMFYFCDRQRCMHAYKMSLTAGKLHT